MMTQMQPSIPHAPSSWRDTYQLIQDSEARLLTALEQNRLMVVEIKGSIEKVTEDHEERLRALEETSHTEGGAKSGRTKLLEAERITIALIISLAAAIVSTASALGFFDKPPA